MALAALTLGKRTPQQAISDPGYFMFGNHRFRDDKEGGHGTVDMYKSIVQSCDTYYYMLANDLGVDAMHDFMTPLGFGQLDRHRPAGRGARHAALDRVEAQAPTARRSSRSGTPARRSRSASARATTPSPCCSWRRRRRRWRPAASATRRTWCARSSTTRAARPSCWRSKSRRRWPWKPEHVAVIHNALYGVTQEGTAARVVRRRRLQVGRQDRHGAGDRDQGEREVQRRARSTSAIATTRSTRRSRRSRSRGSRSPLVVENAGFGAGAAAPIARRVFDFVLVGPVPERGRHRGDPARPVDRRRSACRAPIDAVPLKGSTVDGVAGARVALGREAPAAAAALSARDERRLRRSPRSGSARGRCGPASTAARRSPCVLLAATGLVTMYSVGFDHGTRFVDHGRNMLLAVGVLFVVAQVPPQQLMRFAIPLYLVGLAAAGRDRAARHRHHARRARRAGSTSASSIQPSEIMKIAMPLMLAWWFQRREGQLRALDFVIAGAAAAGAGRLHRQAARPRHRDPGAVGAAST